MTHDTVIVAARAARDYYLRHGAYVCQSGRSFRPVRWMGFYRQRRIEFSLIEGSRHEGDRHGVFVLSPKDDSRTFALDDAINHPGHNAWTMNQRYVSLAALSRASSTGDLT